MTVPYTSGPRVTARGPSRGRRLVDDSAPDRVGADVTASSMSTTRASTSPASTMALSVSPRSVEHGTAADSDSRTDDEADEGGAEVEEERPSASTSRTRPMSSAVRRLSFDVLDVARRRKNDVSTSMPDRPGRRLSSAVLELVGHLERVGLGELLHHDQEARAVGEDRVADQRLVVLHHRR